MALAPTQGSGRPDLKTPVKITIEPYTSDRQAAVRQFNARLAPQKLPVYFHFPERHVPDWLPPKDGLRVYQEFFLAVDDAATVRGGYILKTQDFWINGQLRIVGNLQLPLSEGIVDPRYGFLGVQIVQNALQRRPLLYSLGMGGLDQPYPRLLKGLGWALLLVPFYFRIARPARFLRRMPYVRTTPFRRLSCDVLAWTGLGWIGAHIAGAWVSRDLPRPSVYEVEKVAGFRDWADEVWEASRSSYLLTGARDARTLEALYSRFYLSGLIVLKLTRRGRAIGWAAVLDTQMSGDRYFGDLRVGTLVDGFAAPPDAPAVVDAAMRFLTDRGVDLIVSNQAHNAWVAGLKAARFLQGPSNFAFAMSKPLAEAVAPWEGRWGDFHLNRGDGDGPINL